jgi:phosphinothricin acetyltransferase
VTLAIRAARPGDAAAVAAIYAPFVTSDVVSFETEAPDEAQMALRMTGTDGLYPWLVATVAGPAGETVAGYAYAGRFRERAAYRHVVETSIYLSPEARGRGIGRRLYQALLETLRAQHFTQAMGVITLPNDRSVRLHEAVGFRPVGVLEAVGHKYGRWIDVGLWQCALGERDAPAADILPFTEVGVRLPGGGN